METSVPVEPPLGAVPVAAVRALVGAARVLERASGELSLAQYRVLASVAAGDERASRIAARLALGKPTISATVDSLRQRGLLTRATVDDDQRAAALRLTAEGQTVLDTAERAMLDRLGQLAARTAEPAAVLDALRTLDGAVDGYLAERAAARGAARRPAAAPSAAAPPVALAAPVPGAPAADVERTRR